MIGKNIERVSRPRGCRSALAQLLERVPQQENSEWTTELSTYKQKVLSQNKPHSETPPPRRAPPSYGNTWGTMASWSPMWDSTRLERTVLLLQKPEPFKLLGLGTMGYVWAAIGRRWAPHSGSAGQGTAAFI